MTTLPDIGETAPMLSSHLPPLNSSAVTNDKSYQQTPLLCPSFMHADFEAHLQSTGFPMGDNGQEKWETLSGHCCEQLVNFTSGSPFETLGLGNSGTPLMAGRNGNSQWFQDMPTGSWNAKLTHQLTCQNRENSTPLSPFVCGYNSENVSLVDMMTDNFNNVAATRKTFLSGSIHALPQIRTNISSNAEIFGCNAGLEIDSSKGGLASQDASPYAGQTLLGTKHSETVITNAAEFSSFNKRPALFGSATLQSAANHDSQNLEFAAKPSATQSRVPSGLDTPPCSISNSALGFQSSKCSVLKDRQTVFSSVIGRAIDCHASPRGNKGTVEEETPKMVSRKKPSSLPTLVEIDGSEGTGRPCNSLDESEGSLGIEVSSGCNHENGFEHHPKLSHKKKRLQMSSKVNAMQLSNMKDLDCAKFKEKRQKVGEDMNEDVSSKKIEGNDSDDSMHQPINETSMPTETPKPDYIHVRARRGQATDSHSLAERIRREKISERMKFLQDLVPGCSKITGKAVMLDEIINYVQSLQRQVEFLSMKLAAMNPSVDFNTDSLFRKQIFHYQVSLQQPLMFSEEKLPPYAYLNQQSLYASQRMKDSGGIARSLLNARSLGGGSDPAFLGAISANAPLISKEVLVSNDPQASQAWDDELQNLVQTSYAQGRQACLTPFAIQGERASTPGPLKPET